MTVSLAKKHARRENADVDALVHAHLQLVRRLAWHVYGRVSSATELEELVQVGMIALIEAARAFEDLGYAFSTYASLRIKGAMIDHLRRGAARSRKASAAHRAIEATRETIESKRAGSASATDIAQEMGVSIDLYYQMEFEANSGKRESLDCVYSDSTNVFLDISPNQEEILIDAQFKYKLSEIIRKLEPRLALVINLYFIEEMNLFEIASVLNITAARVCQLKARAINFIKKELVDCA